MRALRGTSVSVLRHDRCNVYGDGGSEDIEEFKRPYTCLTDQDVRFHAVLGNHDVHDDGGEPQVSDPDFGMPFHYPVYSEGTAHGSTPGFVTLLGESLSKFGVDDRDRGAEAPLPVIDAASNAMTVTAIGKAVRRGGDPAERLRTSLAAGTAGGR